MNGQSLGKKSLTTFSNRIINWNIAYKPGVLKVTGYKKGNPVTNYLLKTARDAYGIKAEIIKDSIGKSDVVQIPVRIVDIEDNLVYDADNDINVSIKGNAVLLGLESGSSTSHEDYKSNKRKALHGKLIAYVLLQKHRAMQLLSFHHKVCSRRQLY